MRLLSRTRARTGPFRSRGVRLARSSGRERPSGTALVLGNYRPSLTVVRTLSRTGFRVIVGDGAERSMVDRSRYCDAVWTHPPLRQPRRFLSALEGFLKRRPDVSLVFPVSQAAVALLARNRDSLPTRSVLVAPAPDVVEHCLDKSEMFEIASRAGVPFEPFACVRDLRTLAARVEEIGLPGIVRPVGSGPERLPGNRKAVVCPDRETLAREFPAWPERHAALLAQRFSPGPRHNVYFAAREGRLLASVEVRILRTDRRDGTGYAVEGISVAPDAELTAYTRALVRLLGYTGVGCTQFVKPPGRATHFLELNPRLGANFAVVQRCGLDLATAACDLATGRSDRDPPRRFRYPAGVRYAWTFGDLRGLRRARARGEIGPWQAARWSFLALRAAVTADLHLTWSVRDPWPTLALYAYWAPLIHRRRHAGDLSQASPRHP